MEKGKRFCEKVGARCIVPPSTGKVGLALGSGSARGWAHIGVIKALTEAGVHVDYIAGTSIGAVVGAVYASGKIETLENVVRQFDWKQIVSFFDVVFPKSGLIDGNKVADFVRAHVAPGNIEDLGLPFRVISTDLETGSEVVIQEGDVIEAVRTSISIPGIFTPAKKDGRLLLDGGLVNPVPVSVVRDMGADFVIAVDLNHDIIEKKGAGKTPVSSLAKRSLDGEIEYNPTQKGWIRNVLNGRVMSMDLPVLTQIKQWMTKDPVPSIFEVLVSSINIMETQITATRLKAEPPDLLIKPKLGHLKFLEFHRAEEAIAEGYREMKSHINLLI